MRREQEKTFDTQMDGDVSSIEGCVADEHNQPSLGAFRQHVFVWFQARSRKLLGQKLAYCIVVGLNP